MTRSPNRTLQPPDVDATEMIEHKRLEAQLLSLDGQVRRFDRVRDRLVAANRDPVAFYNELQARREKLVVALKTSRFGWPPASAGDAPSRVIPIGESLLSRPVAPARFDPALGTFGIGTSGIVQVAPASDNNDVVAQGPYPHSGDLTSVPGGYPGVVAFEGSLEVGPDSWPVDQYDPTLNYFWIRSWKYLIPFPAPNGLSRFTYRFDVQAMADIFFQGGEASLMCFVSLGETPNLTTGVDVTANISGAWPLIIDDLSEPGPTYNGHYGYFISQPMTIQRSFMVGDGRVPGVAVVVGVIGGLAMGSSVAFPFWAGPDYSRITLGLLKPDVDGFVGHVEYSYEPQLVNE